MQIFFSKNICAYHYRYPPLQTVFGVLKGGGIYSKILPSFWRGGIERRFCILSDTFCLTNKTKTYLLRHSWFCEIGGYWEPKTYLVRHFWCSRGLLRGKNVSSPMILDFKGVIERRNHIFSDTSWFSGGYWETKTYLVRHFQNFEGNMTKKILKTPFWRGGYLETHFWKPLFEGGGYREGGI